MKKAILLIAVLLLVGSSLFAEASFGIWGRTRFAAALGDNGRTLEQTATNWSLWGNKGPQMQFNYSWSSDKMGYTFKWVMNGDGFNSAGFDYYGGAGIEKAYGTLKLIPALLTLHIGYMQDYDQFRFEGGAQITTFNTLNVGRFNGWGIIAVLAPKDSGFVLAAQYAAELFSSNSSVNGNQLTLNLNNISIAAEYQMPDIFKVQAGLVRNGNKQGQNEIYPNVANGIITRVEADPYSGANNDNVETGGYNIFLRLHLLAVQGLTLNLTGEMAGLLEPAVGISGGAWDNWVERNTLYARFGIAAFAVAVGAETAMMIPKTSGNNSTFQLAAYVEPSYNLGPITVGLGGMLVLPVSYTVGVSPMDAALIQIQPWVLINDFSTRIYFDYIINPDRNSLTNDYRWDVKFDFTFSF